MTREEAIKWLSDELLFLTRPNVNQGSGLEKKIAVCRMAIDALREQEERENPKPLTLDELRKMGGEPYYHISLQGGENHWAILDPLIAKHIEDYHYGEYWLAFRSEPKEEKL